MTRAVTYGHQNMLQLNRPLIKSESAVTRSPSCTISEILPRFQHTQMSVISKSLSASMLFNIIGQSFKHIIKDIAQRSCAMVLRWRFFASFLHPVFPASRLQHLSDLHSKFALGPHVSKYGRHSICDG